MVAQLGNAGVGRTRRREVESSESGAESDDEAVSFLLIFLDFFDCLTVAISARGEAKATVENQRSFGHPIGFWEVVHHGKRTKQIY